MTSIPLPLPGQPCSRDLFHGLRPDKSGLHPWLHSERASGAVVRFRIVRNNPPATMVVSHERLLAGVIEYEIVMILYEINSIENKIGLISHEITLIEYEITSIENKIDSIENEISSIENKINLIENEIELIEYGVGSIENEISDREINFGTQAILSRQTPLKRPYADGGFIARAAIGSILSARYRRAGSAEKKKQIES